MEFIVQSHSFVNCMEAIQHLNVIKRQMIEKEEQEKGYYSYSAWMKMVNHYLALAEQCRRQPTKEFEHYPRLATDYAMELLKIAMEGVHEESKQAFIKSYIHNFDLSEYIQEYL